MADVLASEATCSSSLVSDSTDTGALRATLVSVRLAGEAATALWCNLSSV